jgi:RNase H-fold protein (predicted Holliday junction resolvase)
VAEDSFKPDTSAQEPVEKDPEPGALVPRILGFDVGDRRIGLAISDPLGYTAQPLFTLHRTGKRADLKSVGRVLRKHGVTEAVVGNPLYMSGDQSPQAVKAQAFAEELRGEFGLVPGFGNPGGSFDVIPSYNRSLHLKALPHEHLRARQVLSGRPQKCQKK